MAIMAHPRLSVVPPPPPSPLTVDDLPAMPTVVLRDHCHGSAWMLDPVAGVVHVSAQLSAAEARVAIAEAFTVYLTRDARPGLRVLGGAS